MLTLSIVSNLPILCTSMRALDIPEADSVVFDELQGDENIEGPAGDQTDFSGCCGSWSLSCLGLRGEDGRGKRVETCGEVKRNEKQAAI
jgi:hypothetical protein